MLLAGISLAFQEVSLPMHVAASWGKQVGGSLNSPSKLIKTCKAIQ